MNLKKILEEYEKVARSEKVEEALWHFLKANEEKLTPLFEQTNIHNIHKIVRQVDVFDEGHSDMVLWLLMDMTNVFWDILEKQGK